MSKSKKELNHAWQIDFLFNEFEKESDRAAVILAVSLIDEALKSLLNSFLLPSGGSSDEIFDGANAPIGNLSAKIALAQRLGLISTRFCRDIHLLRKIRNAFAHDVYGCNFENGSVKSRILELDKSITRFECNNLRETQGIKGVTIPEGSRGDFLIICAFILSCLHGKIKNITRLKDSDSEQIYHELLVINQNSEIIVASTGEIHEKKN